jgi:LEA14-like dessication related protein
MKIVLKELRETLICLRVIEQMKLYEVQAKVGKAKQASNELISIFVKSIETAQRNMKSC